VRKYYWYISIFFKKHGVVVLGSIVVAIVIFSLFLPFVVRLLEFKKTSYIGIIGDYTLTSLPKEIQEKVSSGLTKIQPDGSVVPDLAERWITENDGKTYRFLIKQNIHWQDGKVFTTNDVNYDFNKVQVVPTQNEVVFRLSEAFAPFQSVVSLPLFRVTEEPYAFFFKKQKLVGLGAYQVTDFTQRGQWLSEIVLSNANEKLVYRFYLTEDDAISAFKRGEVDVLNNLSSPGDLQNWPSVEVNQNLDTASYLGVFFNTTSDLFSSNEIRQALNYALPKPTDETRAVGPINPKSWAFSPVAKTYDFDEQRAIDRLLSVMPGQPMNIELTTLPIFNDEANQIKKSWEDFGQKAYAQCLQSTTVKEKSLCPNTKISVTIRLTNFPDTSNFQALLIAEESPTDPDQYALWHSQQPTNFTQYKNVRIDGLLEKGRQTEDQKARFTIYSDFQQFFSEDAPVIFIQHLYKYDVKRKGK